MFQLPVGYVQYGTNGPDSVTYLRSGHTATEPRTLTVTRSAATANGNGTFSVPQYRLRFSNGLLDAEGKPRAEKSTIEVTIRQPVGSPSTAVVAAIADAAAFLGSTEFVDDATNDLMFPRETFA